MPFGSREAYLLMHSLRMLMTRKVKSASHSYLEQYLQIQDFKEAQKIEQVLLNDFLLIMAIQIHQHLNMDIIMQLTPLALEVLPSGGHRAQQLDGRAASVDAILRNVKCYRIPEVQTFQLRRVHGQEFERHARGPHLRFTDLEF